MDYGTFGTFLATSGDADAVLANILGCVSLVFVLSFVVVVCRYLSPYVERLRY